MIADEFHRTLPGHSDSCPGNCELRQTLRHLEQNVRSDERKYIIPKICKRCEEGQELVRDIRGDYCHRAHVGAYLHDCHAAAIHEMLVTPAVQVEET